MDTNCTWRGQPDRRRGCRKPGSAALRRQRGTTRGGATRHELTNSQLAELLARQAEKARPPLSRAFRRASRRAFLWPEEASSLQKHGHSLTELQSIGPYLEKVIRAWIEDPHMPPAPPALRSGFLTFTEAQAMLAAQPGWIAGVKGDLQLHSVWSDGSASVAELAAAAVEMDYEYIAITDHAKGLKIAGGIDEAQLREQGAEIDAINRSLKRAGHKLRVLRSAELNLTPNGEGDMEPQALAELDVVIGCFHSALRRKEDQSERYLAALRIPLFRYSGIHAA